jgi:1-acyl-sn-glycerol-3-phosphate acyltransferase
MPKPPPYREDPDLVPWEWLYGLTGITMWMFVRGRFRVEIVGRLPRVGPGQVWIATHRAETDVPLLAGLLYVQAGMWRGARSRVYFAARDDLYRPGVVAAGIRLPAPLARLVWPLSPGPWLPRVRAYPIRRPTGLKLEQVLADLPGETPLAGLLGPRPMSCLERAAQQRGQPRPLTVANARDARYARELWEDVTAGDLVGDRGREVWRAHIAKAAGDLRRIVGLIREGRPILLFPEGRVSPDGGVGPIGDLIDLVVRRGRPESVIPVGIAYDPLTLHRTEVAVGVGTPGPPDGGQAAVAAADALRRAIPVTCGQVLARYVVRASASGIGSVDAAQRLAAEVARAAAVQGRPVSRGLRSRSRRPARVRDGLAALERRACIVVGPDGRIRIDARRIHDDLLVQRLASEDRDVWRPPRPSAPVPGGLEGPRLPRGAARAVH